MTSWLTPRHLNFFLGAFLALQTGLFLYLESTDGVTDRQDRIRGRDFLQFYLAGHWVAERRPDLLYNQERFLELQKSMSPVTEKNPPYLSIYPPHCAILFSPLSHLPYPRAIEWWWLVQFCCIVLSAWLIVKQIQRLLSMAPESNLQASWLLTAWLGVLGFYPVINTFWNGQISAVLLVAFVVGFALHRQQRYTFAGLVFSLLSLKPQIAIGIYFWLILRGDWRTLSGVAFGGLCQLGLVVGLLGHEVLIQYVLDTRLASAWYSLYTISPDHQHGITRILTTLFSNEFVRYAMLTQVIVAFASGFCLWKLRRTPYEYAAAILFTLNCAPHLLTYDLAYLLVAVASLLVHYQDDTRVLKPIVLIYVSAMIAPLYVATQVSLVPIAMMAALGSLYYLQHTKQKQDSLSRKPCLAE